MLRKLINPGSLFWGKLVDVYLQIGTTVNPVQVWLFVSAFLFAVEFLIPIPTFFIAEALGVGALLTALFLYINFVPLPLGGQVIIWLIFSSGFVWYSRRWLPKYSPLILKESSVGVTTTEILPGEAGRVKYDGVSWRAICEDPTLSIGENVKVQIVDKRGTTLIVLPVEYIHSTDFYKPLN